MYRTGHYGAALLVYAPLGFLLLATGEEGLALIGAVIAVGGSMTPDLDHKLPFLRHRGVTHTVWFAIAVGLALGWAGFVVGSASGWYASRELTRLGFVLGTTSIVAHLLADGLTPMGIRPFVPFGSESYSLDLVRADNSLGNYLLLLVGTAAAGAALYAGYVISLPWV